MLQFTVASMEAEAISSGNQSYLTHINRVVQSLEEDTVAELAPVAKLGSPYSLTSRIKRMLLMPHQKVKLIYETCNKPGVETLEIQRVAARMVLDAGDTDKPPSILAELLNRVEGKVKEEVEHRAAVVHFHFGPGLAQPEAASLPTLQHSPVSNHSLTSPFTTSVVDGLLPGSEATATETHTASESAAQTIVGGSQLAGVGERIPEKAAVGGTSTGVALQHATHNPEKKLDGMEVSSLDNLQKNKNISGLRKRQEEMRRRNLANKKSPPRKEFVKDYDEEHEE